MVSDYFKKVPNDCYPNNCCDFPGTKIILIDLRFLFYDNNKRFSSSKGKTDYLVQHDEVHIFDMQ